MKVSGWDQTASQEGCVKSHPKQLFCTKKVKAERVATATTVSFLSLSLLKAPYSLSTPSKHSIFFSHYVPPPHYFSPVSVHNTVYFPRFIPLLFQYTTLYITHDLFLSCFSTKNCISPTLYFSPVSVHNTVYHPRSISLLFQYKTLYITRALFLSCFSTQHCISPTLYSTPVSVHNTA
jgi:hypothetical protein